METPLVKVSKFMKNVNGYLTKVAAMPIYSKSPLNIFSRTKRPMALVCTIGDVGPTRFAQLMDPGCP